MTLLAYLFLAVINTVTLAVNLSSMLRYGGWLSVLGVFFSVMGLVFALYGLFSTALGS